MQFMQSFGNVCREVVAQCLGAALPPACVGCGVPLGAREEGFCPTCYAALPWWNTQQVLAPQLARVVHQFAAPLLYKDTARAVLLGFKFGDQTHFARPLAKLMAPCAPRGADLLMPVPMHPKRLRERTFNQAALLAQALGPLVNVPVEVMSLRRLIASDGQVSRGRAERLRLSSRHFDAAPVVVRGKHVVLIDDILTTGSTARACALALRRAGAARVSVLTVCLTTAGDV